MIEMRGKLCFWMWVLLLWQSSMARFVVEKNSLKVTSPESLRGVFECAIGNFGVPQYGGTMVGVVVYPKVNRRACKSFDEFDVSFKSKAGGFPTFVLVDRGGATTGVPTRTSMVVRQRRKCRGSMMIHTHMKLSTAADTHARPQQHPSSSLAYRPQTTTSKPTSCYWKRRRGCHLRHNRLQPYQISGFQEKFKQARALAHRRVLQAHKEEGMPTVQWPTSRMPCSIQEVAGVAWMPSSQLGMSIGRTNLSRLALETVTAF